MIESGNKFKQNGVNCVLKDRYNYSAQNGCESRFRDRCFFLCWALLHIMVCSIAPLDLYCAIVDYFSRYDLSFKWSGKVVKDLAMIRDLMRRVCVTVTEIQTWNVLKLFQAWNVTRDFGWTLGELSGWGWPVKLAEVSVSVDLFLQCPSQVAAESSLSQARRLVRIGKKVVIAELGDWDMHSEHKQYIFKAITKTFDKPESLAISTISEKHLYQRFIKVN